MTTETQQTGKTATTAQILERLARFDGPPEQFLRHLLAMQCRLVAATAAVVVVPGEDGQQRLAAVWPEPKEPGAPDWLVPLGQPIGGVLSDGQTRLVPMRRPDDLYGAAPTRHAICLPLRSETRVRGAAVFVVDSRERQVLETCRERLELTAPLLTLYELQLTLQQRQAQMQQLASGMETTAAVNDQDRFAGAAMALCNDLAARWRCQRVAMGILHGRYVKLKALSHTEKFSRKMALVGQVEAAMEECVDQDVEVLAPAPPEARYVYRAADALAKQHGPAHVLCMPLRHQGECVGVLLLQRPVEEPFDPAEVQALRLTADLAWPHVYQLSRHDRWIGAKAATGTRKALAAAVGPKHTWTKVIVLGVLGFLAFAFLVKGTFKVEAPFLISTQTQRQVAAPFSGTLRSSDVQLGQRVQRGDLLAEFDTSELEKQAARLQAQVDQHRAEAMAARGEAVSAMDPSKQADYEIAMARARQAEAQLSLLQQQIAKGRVVAPIDGVIVQGEWYQTPDRAFEEGEMLFEIAPAGAVEAELLVDERDVDELSVGNGGELATLAQPGRKIRFTITRIEPVATTENGESGFKVHVNLLEPPTELKLGQTGVGRVELDDRIYADIWTRRARDWVRMKLWW